MEAKEDSVFMRDYLGKYEFRIVQSEKRRLEIVDFMVDRFLVTGPFCKQLHKIGDLTKAVAFEIFDGYSKSSMEQGYMIECLKKKSGELVAAALTKENSKYDPDEVSPEGTVFDAFE